MAQELRYTIHNTLLELGQWSLISTYLKDVCDLEEKFGYARSLGDRRRLMNAARDLTEQAMEIAAKRTSHAVTRHPKFEEYFMRKFVSLISSRAAFPLIKYMRDSTVSHRTTFQNGQALNWKLYKALKQPRCSRLAISMAPYIGFVSSERWKPSKAFLLQRTYSRNFRKRLLHNMKNSVIISSIVSAE
jgi:hypothetical protein